MSIDNCMSKIVLNHPLCAVLAGEPMIERELEPFLARIVHVGKSDHVSGDLGRGVVATIFARQVHARNVERTHFRRIGRLQMTRDVQKFSIQFGGDEARQLVGITIERPREIRDLLVGER
jgi:hypothetical protein